MWRLGISTLLYLPGRPCTGGVERTLSELSALREEQEKRQQTEARFAEVRRRVSAIIAVGEKYPPWKERGK